MIIETSKDWEQLIRETHSAGKTIGYAMESNRLYQDRITFENRVEQLKKKVDVVCYIFNPRYQEMVQIDEELGLKLFGDKPRDDIDKVIRARKHLVDHIFITPDDLPYRQEVKEWIYRNGPLLNVNDYLDAYSYIRGCYATEDYLNTVWKEKVDYIVACPWRMKYNVFCLEAVNRFGVKIEMPGDINIEEIIRGDR